jgi:hypothetical protein
MQNSVNSGATRTSGAAASQAKSTVRTGTVSTQDGRPSVSGSAAKPFKGVKLSEKSK